ncbi:hypothetical protein JCM6882_001569 [Rhodosporidiobolus microsporus]
MRSHRPLRSPSARSAATFAFSPSSNSSSAPPTVFLSSGKRHHYDSRDSGTSDSDTTSGSSGDESTASSGSGSAEERGQARRHRGPRRRQASASDSSSPAIILVLGFLLIVAISVAVYFGMQKSSSGQENFPVEESASDASGVSEPTRTTCNSDGDSDGSTASSTTASKDETETASPSPRTENASADSSTDPTATTTATGDDSEPTASAPSSDDPFIQECLTAHNDFRATHHADPLVWNETLADAASRWIDVCKWEHSEGSLLPSGYGENLFGVAPVKEDAQPDAAGGIKGWNDEVNMYTFDPPTGFTKETGHFTQVVWKGTQQLGCAMRPCKGLFKAGEFGNYLVCEASL